MSFFNLAKKFKKWLYNFSRLCHSKGRKNWLLRQVKVILIQKMASRLILGWKRFAFDHFLFPKKFFTDQNLLFRLQFISIFFSFWTCIFLSKINVFKFIRVEMRCFVRPCFCNLVLLANYTLELKVLSFFIR